MTLGIATVSTTTISITTLFIALSVIQNATPSITSISIIKIRHSITIEICHSALVSFMLNVAIKPIRQSAVMPNAVTLTVMAPTAEV
jgi:hypothetical protein